MNDYTEEISLDSSYGTKLLMERIRTMIQNEIKKSGNYDRKIPCMVTYNNAYGYADISLNGTIGSTPNIIQNVRVAGYVVPRYQGEYYVTAINGSMNNLIIDSNKQITQVNTDMDIFNVTSSTNVWIYDGCITADATGGSIVLTLPSAASNLGHWYVFKRLNSGANTVTIQPTLSQTIDGAANKVLTSQYEVVRIISNGTNWYII